MQPNIEDPDLESGEQLFPMAGFFISFHLEKRFLVFQKQREQVKLFGLKTPKGVLMSFSVLKKKKSKKRSMKVKA